MRRFDPHDVHASSPTTHQTDSGTYQHIPHIPTPSPSLQEDDEEIAPFEETIQRGRPRGRRGPKESRRTQDANGRREATTLEGRGRPQVSEVHALEDDAGDAAPLPQAEEPARIELFPDNEWTQPYVQPSQQSDRRTSAHSRGLRSKTNQTNNRRVPNQHLRDPQEDIA